MGQLKVIVDAYQPSKSIYVKFVVNDEEITKKLMQINNKLKPLVSKDGKGVQIIIPHQAIESFINGTILPKIFNICVDSGLSLPKMNEVTDDIKVASQGIVTSEMKQEAMGKYNNLIETFFERYSDPEVMKLINQLVHDLKIKVGDDDMMSHAILSKPNRLLAYSQKRDATYIASARTWRDVFGRRVVVGGQPIVIRSGDNGNSYDSSYANSKLGTTKDSAYGNSHNHIAYDRVAKFGQSDPTSFMAVIYYDVSDTTPYSDTDSFLDDAGLESNLTGTLNSKALEQNPQVSVDNDSEIDNELLKANHTNEGRIFANIVTYCKNKEEYKSVMIAAANKDINNPNSCADVLEAMFRVKFEREHDLQLMNQKVKKCTAFVLSIYNAATNRMVAYMGMNNDVFNRKSLTEMYSQILDVVDIIDSNVSESIGGNRPTFKEFLDALQVDISTLNNGSNNDIENNNNNVDSELRNEERIKIRESFRSLWNRMI